MTPMPTPCCPLFAAGFDWLEALLPFLFVAFWIISQVFAVLRRIGGGPQPPARIDRPRPQPQPRPGGDVRSELERQIEEFLRQAGGEQVRRPEAATGTGQRRADQPQRSQQPPVVKTPPAAKPATSSSGPSRVDRERLAGGMREVRRVARPAAAAAPGAVESVEHHVQDAFSHDLAHSRGGLAQESTAPATVTHRSNDIAAELVAMLRSPEATRRAILLREVLDRPVDRW
jgi:hypothetical protein